MADGCDYCNHNGWVETRTGGEWVRIACPACGGIPTVELAEPTAAPDDYAERWAWAEAEITRLRAVLRRIAVPENTTWTAEMACRMAEIAREALAAESRTTEGTKSDA